MDTYTKFQTNMDDNINVTYFCVHLFPKTLTCYKYVNGNVSLYLLSNIVVLWHTMVLQWHTVQWLTVQWHTLQWHYIWNTMVLWKYNGFMAYN